MGIQRWEINWTKMKKEKSFKIKRKPEKEMKIENDKDIDLIRLSIIIAHDDYYISW